MSFNTRSGTRGARQPGGKLMLWLNKLMMKRIRKSGRAMGFNALVLTTVGSKSGTQRQTPVGWFPGEDGDWLIVASAAGAARNPAWYYNLAAHPDKVEIDVDGERIPVTARELHGPQRQKAWQRITSAVPRFGGYQTKTDRVIPVISLTRRVA